MIRAWGEMEEFYTAPFVGLAVKDALDRANIPVDWLEDSLSKNINPRLDSVRLMTAHSSKGLQYQVVIVAGVGDCIKGGGGEPFLSQSTAASP
jgi:superfamily I DNA/RNA helicase